MNHRTRNFLAALLTASVLPLGVTDAFAGNRIVLGNAAQTSLAASAEAHTAKTLKELRSKAAKGETIRVIVGVRAAFAPEGELSIADVAQQRQEIADMHSAVLQKIPSLKAKPEKIKTFSTIPFMALEVDATELEALAGQAEITSIEEDRLVQATLPILLSPTTTRGASFPRSAWERLCGRSASCVAGAAQSCIPTQSVGTMESRILLGRIETPYI